MAEEPGAPGTAPVTDHRPVPRGVLPRGFQTWLMAGLALGIVLIILLTGQPEPPAEPDAVAAGACRAEPGSAARLPGAPAGDGGAPGTRGAGAPQPTAPADAAFRASPPAPRLRIRSPPTASVASTRACSRATSCSAVGRRQSARKPVEPLASRPARRRATASTPSLDEIAEAVVRATGGTSAGATTSGRSHGQPASDGRQQPRLQRRRPTGTHA